VFSLDYIADVVAPRSEDPELIIRAMTFEVVQPICPAYINVTDNVTDGQTDGRTEGRTTYDSYTALALRTSCGKNYENWLLVDKVIAYYRVTSSFLRQCRL